MTRNWKHGIHLPRPLVRRDRDVRRTIACNMGMWREDLAAVNGWNEDFRNDGTNDWELAARLLNLGLTRKFVRGWAAVYQLSHPSSTLPDEVEARHKAILRETMESGRIRCANGLDQHL